MRKDFETIIEWIRPNSRVLDLGCGTGELLGELQKRHAVTGVGLEIDDENIIRCLDRGVTVLQTDLDNGLRDLIDDHSFDYVVMTQTIQAMKRPAELLGEMLRVGNEAIITFPNMGFWHNRLQMLRGRMPLSRNLPAQWYDTENIHLCTLADFEDLCAKLNLHCLQKEVVGHHHTHSTLIRLLPNLLGEQAIYRLKKK